MQTASPETFHHGGEPHDRIFTVSATPHTVLARGSTAGFIRGLTAGFITDEPALQVPPSAPAEPAKPTAPRVYLPKFLLTKSQLTRFQNASTYFGRALR